MSENSLSQEVVLNSWKEIAVYLGRGVRTVQRWERDLGMPVRRPRAKSRSAVIALVEEIDDWLRRAPTATLPLSGKYSENVATVRQAIDEHLLLRKRCNQLRAANQIALHNLISRLEQMHQSVTPQEDPPVLPPQSGGKQT